MKGEKEINDISHLLLKRAEVFPVRDKNVSCVWGWGGALQLKREGGAAKPKRMGLKAAQQREKGTGAIKISLDKTEGAG